MNLIVDELMKQTCMFGIFYLYIYSIKKTNTCMSCHRKMHKDKNFNMFGIKCDIRHDGTYKQ